MFAVCGVLHTQIQCALGHTNGAGGGLDARRFEGLHQLLKPFALFSTQQVFAFDMEIVEGQLIFLHPAISQNFYFTAGHSGCGEGHRVGAGGFFGQKHRQAAMVGAVGVCARQKGHNMGAGRVGDPSFIARDAVIIAVFGGAGPQGA